MEALSYRGVSKTFGEVRAVKPLDLDIPQGGIFGLLGPNGAGKSTLIRMTLGILLPDAGDVKVLGGTRGLADRGLFGYLPEERGLYPKMKVGDLLKFFGCLRGLSSSQAQRAAREGLERVGLAQWEKKKVEELSKGMQQKVQILVALIHKPRIAILDEPFSGLDPVNVDLFKEIVRETVASGTTVVLSTHQMELVEALCEHIALINKGEVVLKGEVDAIRREYGLGEIRVEFAGAAPNDGVVDDLVLETHLEEGRARYHLKPDVPAREVLKRLLDRGLDVTRYEEAQASMHDIFVRVVKGGN
jgi:ABC-2 type transport system ATP-binding protein